MTQYPEAWLCRELGMAVVNIALITDYDAGVHEGTEAVDAQSVLEVFAQNAERIQKVVLDLIGRFPADLDALGARRRPRPDPRRRPRDRRPRTSGCSRRGSERTVAAPSAADRGCARLDRGDAGVVARERAPARGRRLPRASGAGTTSSAGRQDRPGGRAVDDPVRGRRRDAAGSALGTFVTNVMNRHPAVLARMAATLQIASGGRLTLGIGIGGGAAGARARTASTSPSRRSASTRLEEAVAVDPRAVDRRPGHAAEPASIRSRRRTPIPCRIRRRGSSSAASSPRGVRLAARIGDGWAAEIDDFERAAAAPTARRSRPRAGRSTDALDRARLRAAARPARTPLERQPWVERAAGGVGALGRRWASTRAIVTARTTERRRRARRGRRSLVARALGRGAIIAVDDACSQPRGRSAPPDARADAPVHPLRARGRARGRRAVRALQPARAVAAVGDPDARHRRASGSSCSSSCSRSRAGPCIAGHGAVRGPVVTASRPRPAASR